MSTTKERQKEIKEKMKKDHYRISNGEKICANCAHMETLERGPNKGLCLCRPMDYFFANTTQNKAHTCDKFMYGSRQDGLISELAALIIENNNAASKRKAECEERKHKLQIEREKCINALSHQKGFFAAISRRTLQKRINQIEKELKELEIVQ